jgi:predicted RNase H-like HicB family nuclease
LPHYSVYLETADDGRCMAHVLDLPGCIVRAPTRDEALSRVPEAIGEILAWLRRHGEPAPAASEDAIQQVARW